MVSAVEKTEYTKEMESARKWLQMLIMEDLVKSNI